VRYLATLIGAGNETVLRWFILVVALLLDPAAVALGSDADTVLSAKSQDGVQGVRRAGEAVGNQNRPPGRKSAWARLPDRDLRPSSAHGSVLTRSRSPAVTSTRRSTV
jgi:hypothetical protein